MDNRKILQPQTLLSFPGMACTVESLAGAGSNAIVYYGSYPDGHLRGRRHHVLIKELFPCQEQGLIYRDDKNHICWEADAEEEMALQRLSFQRGNEIHLKLLEEHPGEIDANINTFSMHHTLYTVLGFTGGRSMDKELDAPGGGAVSLRVHIRRMLGALHVLEAFHESGFLHLDVSPDNILLIGNGENERVTLIDYNSVHTLQEIRSGQSVYYSEKEGFTAPEIRFGRISDIGCCSDLYALAAVFYQCIAGVPLTQMQMRRAAALKLPDVPCLKGLPETVLDMVRKILKKGLAYKAVFRYQSAGQMRLDFQELWNRMEGKGITHWALWETGRANVLRAVKANPALEYIRDEKQVYPVTGVMEDGTQVSLTEIMQQLTAPQGSSVLLSGSGGMGKTTALLRAAYLQKKTYSPSETAVTYLSLYGLKDSSGSCIKNRILEELRFRPETDSMETARHELVRLLSGPLQTKRGSRPKLLILLDGLNEVSGDISVLLQEILELSQMEGVRIFLTSRSRTTELNFTNICLKQLEEDETAQVLAQNGLVPPENPGMRELLRIPMMLSIFVKTAQKEEKQLIIDTRDELLQRYFTAMLDKELHDLPEDSPKRWRTEASFYYVLPQIAALLHRKRSAGSDRVLLPEVEKCYRSLAKRSITAVFPQWIGHFADIRGDAANAEEWYGQVIHEILWRRLGLLIRDEQGSYRIVHQLIEEYLLGMQKDFGRKFRRQKAIRLAAAVTVTAGLTAAAFKYVYLPYAAPLAVYDQTLADSVFSSSFAAYIEAANQYEDICSLIETLNGDPADENGWQTVLNRCIRDLEADRLNSPELASAYLDRLLGSGEVMPWSKQPLDTDAYQALARLSAERAEDYLYYIRILMQLRNDAQLWDYFGQDYVSAFSRAAQSDAFVLGKYYQILLRPELDEMKAGGEKEQQDYRLCMTDTGLCPRQHKITEQAEEILDIYETLQKEAWNEFLSNGAIAILGQDVKKEE